MSGITVKDLPELQFLQDSNDPNPFLFCEVCGGHYSATKGDYFWKDEDEVFECCDEPMRLVTSTITYTDWKKPEKKSDVQPAPV